MPILNSSRSIPSATCRHQTPRRSLSTPSSTETEEVTQWKELPKTAREWLYYIDVHGQLFLHDTFPRNLTSCFKDKKFLDFFFTRLQVNHYGWDRGDGHTDYRYVSPCGREVNFIKSEDAPIVFHDLTPDHRLVWGGTLSIPFDPSRLYVGATHGRIYHPAPPTHPVPPPFALRSTPSGVATRAVTTAPGSGEEVGAAHTEKIPPLGLLRSSLVQSALADGFDGEAVEWMGKRYPVTLIDDSGA
ncbi:hypothetical protein HDU96_005958 [Phlyctochytrium bullatum]|nr:hypothetical protein HDU96_005958 [Phlyctochytrium bullatum]